LLWRPNSESSLALEDPKKMTDCHSALGYLPICRVSPGMGRALVVWRVLRKWTARRSNLKPRPRTGDAVLVSPPMPASRSTSKTAGAAGEVSKGARSTSREPVFWSNPITRSRLELSVFFRPQR